MDILWITFPHFFHSAAGNPGSDVDNLWIKNCYTGVGDMLVRRIVVRGGVGYLLQNKLYYNCRDMFKAEKGGIWVYLIITVCYKYNENIIFCYIC